MASLGGFRGPRCPGSPPTFVPRTRHPGSGSSVRIKKRTTTDEGQAVVEFAVILPVLLMVLFAILQFGVVFNNYIQVTAAAREGARKASVSRSLGTAAAETAATAAAKAAAPGLKQSSITVTYPNSPT